MTGTGGAVKVLALGETSFLKTVCGMLGGSSMEKFMIVVSDCHLSAGRQFERQLNPHEDFHFDEEMVDLFEHFSTGRFGEGPEGPVPVELVLAGDYLDFLNVPIDGEFEEPITEEMALAKLEAILRGHAEVFDAIRRFASLPAKKVTYLIGNHDADLFFPQVRERITRAWDPEGRYPSPVVELVADRDRLTFDGGVEIRHGNQFEASSLLNFEKPVLHPFMYPPVLNIPWSSIYVLKIINRLKWEREYVDKVRPAKAFVLFGLVLDPWFTLKFVFLSTFYFLKTRFLWSPMRRARFGVTLEILKQEAKVFLDLEREARQLLDEREDLQTIIFGHTHKPMNKVYPDGKQYINTGTWTKMINLDWRGLGQQVRRTFAFVHIKDGKSHCELRQWVGEHSPHTLFDGA
jgi:UDP-2,3-diacylglucosamine pyrophosphatase LpxH